MDDLASRLRNSYKSDALWNLCTEAADEIVRLVDKCSHLEAELARLERLNQ